VDQDPLVTFDGLVQGCDVGKRQKLRLGDVRRGPSGAAARRDQTREADERAGHDARRREPDERRDERCGQEGSAIGMAYRPLLGHGFGEHEDHDDLERGGDRDADRAEHLCSYDADERGGNELEEQDEQQDRREECLGLLHEPAQ
jgi:hypothetical protein